MGVLAPIHSGGALSVQPVVVQSGLSQDTVRQTRCSLTTDLQSCKYVLVCLQLGSFVSVDSTVVEEAAVLTGSEVSEASWPSFPSCNQLTLGLLLDPWPEPSASNQSVGPKDLSDYIRVHFILLFV